MLLDPLVTSETAPLRQVLVHTPGEELALVSPKNKDELLFDDLLFPENAQEEHRTMCALFRMIVGEDDAVVQLSDVLKETFENEDARISFVETLARLLPERNFEAYEADLKKLSPEKLHWFAFTGKAPFPVSAHPLPNLLFTRDPAAVACDHVVISHAATEARLPESAIFRTIFRHHPAFSDLGDRLIELPEEVDFEGGDLLVVSDRIVLIGQSERTTLGGALSLARELLERTSVEHVLVVNLPKQRSSMHLDTVFTFADPSTCIAFPPIIQEARDNVFHLESDRDSARRRGFRMRILPNLQTALEELLDREMTLIPCGGPDLVSQQREQWTDGANLFAVRPGLVVGYERNHLTFEALKDHGFHVVDAESFLDFYEGGEVDLDSRIAVRLRGNELSRGRGGPRCMTMPIRRMSVS